MYFSAKKQYKCEFYIETNSLNLKANINDISHFSFIISLKGDISINNK